VREPEVGTEKRAGPEWGRPFLFPAGVWPRNGLFMKSCFYARTEFRSFISVKAFDMLTTKMIFCLAPGHRQSQDKVSGC
ncbi:MAG TPA: hypothetical protein PLY97_09785, partial [Acidocella sp.]|nr:hypothetical protein [Acidocella sp.]